MKSPVGINHPHYTPWLFVMLIALAPAIPVFAQYDNLKFTRITDRDGLSQNTINCSMQDSKGFMWFGTQDGLNRYDGYTFTVYRRKPGDSFSLSENWVWNIYEDLSGTLWIATFGGGMNRYDRETDRFYRYRSQPDDSTGLSHNTIWDFLEYPAGTLWIGANNGLNRLDLQSGEFSYFAPSPQNVFRIRQTLPGKLWVLTNNGLSLFDIESESFTAFPLNMPGSTEEFNTSLSISVIDSNRIWLGTVGGGIVEFSYSSNGSIAGHYAPPINLPAALSTATVGDVLQLDDNTMWIATRNGLCIIKAYGTPEQENNWYYHDPSILQSLSHSRIFSIYESRGGEVWVGTVNGLSRFDRRNQKFRHLSNTSDTSLPLASNRVISLHAAGGDDVIWAGTDKGIFRFRENGEGFQHFSKNLRVPDAGPAGDYVMYLYEDRERNLWIGTRNDGLSRMTVDALNRPQFHHYPYRQNDVNSLGARNVHAIFQDSDGRIWIGTGGGGLNEYDRENDTIIRHQLTPVNEDDPVITHIYAFLEDSRGRFWLGTAAGGMVLLDRQQMSYRCYQNNPESMSSLNSNRVLYLYEDRKREKIWIGTAGGLNRLVEPEAPDSSFRFIQYYASDGLPSEVIYGILEDDAGHLWMSTNKGIVRVTAVGDSIAVKSYSVDDGLQGNEFNQKAFGQSTAGSMYFGGLNGINVFHPDSIRDNPLIPPVIITDFKILNESVPIDPSGGSFLTKHISQTTDIALGYREDVISFEFAALNFTLPEKNQYAYMMEGFDDDWIYSGARRFATYTNLDAGEYAFRVKGSNNDGVWNEAGASLRITITPPPWETWWAYLLYTLAIVGSVLGYVRYRVRAEAKELEAKAAIARAKIEEREKVRSKSSADFHDEAGNILTKITLFTELARRSATGNAQLDEYLAKIEQNTKSLSGRMRDFIWVLDPGKDSLYDTFIRLKDFGNTMFEHSDIRFRASSIPDALKAVNLPMDDRRSIIMIFKEAMNNCLKYSQCNSVRLDLDYNGHQLKIVLRDDGIGFDPAQASSGYGLKNMRLRASKIGGTVYVESTQGEGVSVCFLKELPARMQMN